MLSTLSYTKTFGLSASLFLPPQGFCPDGQNPRTHPKRSPRISDENFAVAEKISIFQEQGSQRIAEKYAKDCRNFAGGRINPLHFIKKAGPALVKTITSDKVEK